MVDKKNIKHNLLAQIPGHVLENYPRFFDFLEAYYEWLCKDENAYGRLSNHLDYMAFEKSLDEYIENFRLEYLTDVPDQTFFDKEQFIKWSRKFNLARGSHASYKFLFRLLFGEQNTDIYIPKDNILKTSDGNWISGESLILLEYSTNNTEEFQFQRIFQDRVLYEDVIERATATVQQVRTKYAGRFIVTELSVSNIEGEFLEGFPIQTDSGVERWPIKTTTTIGIADGGTNYRRSQRVIFDSILPYTVQRTAEFAGLFDTRIDTFYTNTNLDVFVNSVQLASTEFTYDGREIQSTSIAQGDVVEVQFPPYAGYIVVDRISDSGSVQNIEILDVPITSSDNGQPLIVDTNGSGAGLSASISQGLIKPVKGYYEGTKGHLSSNMFLQDSFFYQNYSYSIRTQQDFITYGDLVKQILHPAGFELFGQISITRIIELIIQYQDLIVDVNPINAFSDLHKYGQGANYSFIDKFRDGVSIRLYRDADFNSINIDYIKGEVGYNLESEFLSGLNEYQYLPLKGWMNKFNWADYYLFVQENYSDIKDSGNLYFETGYVSTRISEEIVVNDDTIILS